MKKITWSSLRSLGSNRVLQTSYLWFIVVPILVKLATKIRSSEVTIGTYRLNFDFELPFSWEIFFYSAVFASLAHLIYFWKCPGIIKRFSTYSDFRDQGQENHQLRKEFELLLVNHQHKVSSSQLKENVKEFLRSFCGDIDPSLQPDDIEGKPFLAFQIVSASEIKLEKTGEAFWFVRDFAERLNKNYLLLCFWFYVIALLLIIFVFAQNVWFVVLYSINTHKGA